MYRQRLARFEARQIDRVWQDADFLLRHSVFKYQPVVTSMIDGHIPQQARMDRRRILPEQPTVAGINCRHLGKVQQCGHRLQMVVPVDKIGSDCQLIQIFNYGYGCESQIFRHCAQIVAIDDGRVPAVQQCPGEVTHVGHTSAAQH